MADTLSKESDPKLVFNVDQEAGGEGYGRGADEEDDDDEEGGDEDSDGDGEWVVEGDEGDDGDEDEDEDDEPPPPMTESSGSDCDPSPTSRKAGDKGPAAKKKGAGSSTAAAAAGGGGAGAAAGGKANGADKKAFKPATASEKMSPPPGESAEGVPESPLWTSFVKSRKGGDKDLGVVPLKMWESFETDKCIPRAMKTWYINKVQQNRSVPRALMVPQLPSGFPEFCHWVAEGLHGSCGEGGRLKPGFEPLALDLVEKVKLKERGGRASPAPAPSAAPAAEARKKGRRLRKGGAMANGAGFAEKMQSALAGLGGIDDDDDEGVDAAAAKEGGGRSGGGAGGGVGGQAKAAGRAERAGARVEAEVSRVLREEGAGTEEVGDEGMLGPDFADLRVPHKTGVMIGRLKRAKALRRRSDRQSELLEIELERSLVLLARMETQYQALVAETSGRECTLAEATSRARPLIDEGYNALVDSGTTERALDLYSAAIKMLEVHVGRFVKEAEKGGKGDKEEEQRARTMLGVALHNRSVANFHLGNAYNGQRDARQAVDIWPGVPCENHAKRSEESYKKMIANAPQWAAFAMPP